MGEWPARLVLVRHAESEGNVLEAEERTQLPVPTQGFALTPYGRWQAGITGEYLQENYGEFDVYYTSYYLRAIETMQIMYPQAEIYRDFRLSEGQRGIWNTCTMEQIQKHYPLEPMRKEKEGLYWYRPIGGESWPDEQERIHSFLQTINRDCGGLKVLIVVHGHWTILFQQLIDHFSIEEAIRRYHEAVTNNAAITVYSGIWKKDQPRLELEYANFTPWQGRESEFPV